MKRAFPALAIGLLLLGPAAIPAAATELAASLPDPDEFEVIAVAPRSPESKPVVTSLAVAGSGISAERRTAADLASAPLGGPAARAGTPAPRTTDGY